MRPLCPPHLPAWASHPRVVAGITQRRDLRRERIATLIDDDIDDEDEEERKAPETSEYEDRSSSPYPSHGIHAAPLPLTPHACATAPDPRSFTAKAFGDAAVTVTTVYGLSSSDESEEDDGEDSDQAGLRILGIAKKRKNKKETTTRKNGPGGDTGAAGQGQLPPGTRHPNDHRVRMKPRDRATEKKKKKQSNRVRRRRLHRVLARVAKRMCAWLLLSVKLSAPWGIGRGSGVGWR